MISKGLPTYRQAVLDCVIALLTALMCAGLSIAAALTPAPDGLLPFIIAVCVGLPMLAAMQSSVSFAFLRTRRQRAGRALQELRRELDRLPEIRHPLGL